MSARQLHDLCDCYCQMTGKCAKYQVYEAVLHDFTKKGFTLSDLKLVLGFILSENRRMRGAQYSTRLDLLMDWEYRRFDSLLAEAKARHRSTPRPLSGKDRVLRAWRIPTGEPVIGLAKPIKEILAEMSK